MSYKELELLIDALNSLPSISKKSAEKIAFFLLNQDELYINNLITRILNIKNNLKRCDKCNIIINKMDTCRNCSDNSNYNLVIVNNESDIKKIKESNEFDGTFFVLLNEINYKKRDTSLIDNQFKKIESILTNKKIKEILIATDLTINGELTANYLSGLIKKKFPGITVYRLATGMPLNSSIDYIDVDSLKQSIKNKTKI